MNTLLLILLLLAMGATAYVLVRGVMNMASGKIAFIALCSSPDCVRWHSSTKTKRFPFAVNPCGSAFLTSSTYAATSPTSSPSSRRPNLWTSEQISHGVFALSCAIKSAPLFVR